MWAVLRTEEAQERLVLAEHVRVRRDAQALVRSDAPRLQQQRILSARARRVSACGWLRVERGVGTCRDWKREGCGKPPSDPSSCGKVSSSSCAGATPTGTC